MSTTTCDHRPTSLDVTNSNFDHSDFMLMSRDSWHKETKQESIKFNSQGWTKGGSDTNYNTGGENYGQQPVPGPYKHWWNRWFRLYLLFSQYTTSPFWTQSWHPITSWNISSTPALHTASKQSRAACCPILFATQRYSVINLVLSCCFVSQGTIFCVWNPDWDHRWEQTGPEPLKGREVVVGIRIGLGLWVKGGMEGEGEGGLVCGRGIGLGDEHWGGVWYEEAESAPFLASVPQEHWVSGKEWRD